MFKFLKDYFKYLKMRRLYRNIIIKNKMTRKQARKFMEELTTTMEPTTW